MKTFKKYFIESNKLKAFKSFTKHYDFKPIDGREWFEETDSHNRRTYVSLGHPIIESYDDLNQLFGQPKPMMDWYTKPPTKSYVWGIEFKDGLKGVIISSLDGSVLPSPLSVTLLSNSPRNTKQFAKRIYELFGEDPNLNNHYANLLDENDKFEAFKKFAQTYVIKNKFNSNLIFADDQPNAAANARETERRMEKENMDPYATELLVKHYKDLIDNFGEPNQTRDGGMLYLDWGIEFADGVKVILSIDPHDLYYDDQHNVELESPIVAQVTGPKGRDSEILGRLDTILNKS